MVEVRVALAPPDIPKLPHVRRTGTVNGIEPFGQQARDPKQARLNMQGAAWAIVQQFFAQLRETLHRPDVVLVAQGPKQAFPKRLFPSAVAGACLEVPRFVLEANQRRLLE